MILGMAFGMTAFNITRAAILPALLRSSSSFLARIPFATRAVASSVALVPEVGTIWGTSKAVHEMMHPETNVWDLQNNLQGVLGLGMTLGFLKSFGFIFGGAGALVKQKNLTFLPKNPIFWQQSGMLSGIMAGQGAEILLDWRRPTDITRFLNDSLITLALFNGGGVLSQQAFPWLYHFNGKLQAKMGAQEQRQIRNLSQRPPSDMGVALFQNIFHPWIPPGVRLSMAGAYGNPTMSTNPWNDSIAAVPNHIFRISRQEGVPGHKRPSPGGQVRGLVVEGGGMRGAHSSGAMNALRDHGLTFDIVTGSSAGSANAAYWVDGSPRIDLAWRYHLHGDRFIRYRNFLLGKPLLNLDYLFHGVMKKDLPLNIEKINDASVRFFITVTDCETGRPYYVENKSNTDILGALFAGSAMPFGYPLPVRYGERLSADGGITDSIPFQKALDHGATDLWIILTRPKGYRKGSSKLADRLNRWNFGEYPALAEAMVRRREMYNDQLATVERMETEGKATVIRPAPDLKLNRLQRNQAKLHEAVDQGYQDTLVILKKNGVVTE